MADYFLKILSGPHLGAEVVLRDGRYVMGSDEDCDILLDDGSIAARHLSLQVSGGEIRIAAMDDAVYVDGEKAEPGDVPLLPYRIVTVGTTHFGVGISGEKWPPFDLPAIHGPERPLKETEDPAGREAACGQAGKDRGKRRLLFAGLTAAIPVFLLVFFSLIAPPLPPETPAGPSDPAERLAGVRGALENLGIAGIKASILEDGRMEVRGFVETAGEKRRLVEALRPFRTEPVPLLVRVAVNGRMVEDCRDILGSLGLDLNVESGGPGKIVLTGQAPDEGLLNRGIALLRQDLPALRDVENRVVALAWPVIETAAAVPGSAGEPVRSALPALSVSLGPVPFLSLAGGKKFFEGARWEEGTFIKAIGPDGIVLTRAEETVHLFEGGRP